MARVNAILEISELKLTGMGNFNSDDHYIYYCGQESLRRNGVAMVVNQRVWNAVLGCNLKNDRMISVHLQGKPFNITVTEVCAPTNAEGAEVEHWYEDLQNVLVIKPQPPKKDVFFIIGDWNEKLRSQEVPGVTGKFGLAIQNEAGQRLTEFCQENAPEDYTHGHHQMVSTGITLIIFIAAEDGEALYSQQNQHQELTVAQTMNSLLPNSDLNWRK